jgi:hypothetical protein
MNHLKLKLCWWARTERGKLGWGEINGGNKIKVRKKLKN